MLNRNQSENTPLALTEFVSTIPAHWLEFTASPNRSYIAPVYRDLTTRLGVSLPEPATFATISGVPRYFHPTADSEGLALSLELICWYFTFDDPFHEGVVRTEAQELVQRMVSVLNNGSLPSSPSGCERLCLQFARHARRLAGSNIDIWSRFIDGCVQWVNSIIPINRQLRLRRCTLDEYRQLRLINVGILPEYALNEIILGIHVPPPFLRRADVVRYGELAALVIAYFNDVYSYEFESRRKTQLNSIELRQEGGHSLRTAYEQQVQNVRSMLSEMERIENELTAAGEVGLAVNLSVGMDSADRRRSQTRYLAGIRSIVVGNYLWSQSDGRYHSPTSPFVELRKRRPGRR